MMTPNPPRRGTAAAPANPFGKSQALSPHARLLVGGQMCAVHSATVTNNSYWSADTWSAVVALGPDRERGIDFWGVQDQYECEILFGDRADDGTIPWKSFVQGRASRIRIDDVQGLVHLDGRDYTADLIETQIVDSYHDLAASDVAAMFAAEHGLSADVDATPGKIGTLYAHEHAGVSTGEMSHASTQWDYLVWLAQQYDGYGVWVRGKTLHFKKYTDDTRAPYNLDYVRGVADVRPGGTIRSSPRANAISIDVERDMTRAMDIEVVVRSWHGSAARQFEVVATRAKAKVPTAHRQRGKAPGDPALANVDSGAGDSSAALENVDGFNHPGPAQQNDKAPPKSRSAVHRYVYERPNLTPESALAFAQARLTEATLHERKIVVEMPGELDLDARRMVRLSGYGSGWDQDYYVDEIVRTLSASGFRQTVTAKNESPGGTTTITTTS